MTLLEDEQSQLSHCFLRDNYTLKPVFGSIDLKVHWPDSGSEKPVNIVKH